MAGEIIAALRTVILFIAVSWLSIMYLLVYRFPRQERSHDAARNFIGEEEGISAGHATISMSDEDINNSMRKLQFAPINQQARLVNHKIHESTEQDLQVEVGLHKPLSMFFDCRRLDDVELLDILGSGYTKTVRKGFLNGQHLALKYTTEKNHDILQCMKQRVKRRHFECFNLAKFKLLKEALLFQQLSHPNIVQLIGVCPWRPREIEGSESMLTVITEVGQPLNLIRMIQIPWDDRLKMGIDLVNLMKFLEDSPLGPLTVRDFRIEQLVIVKGVIKLTDLDDIDGKLKQCTTSRDCFIGGLIGNTTLPCKDNICVNFTSKSNLYSLYKTFLMYALKFDNRDEMQEDLRLITNKIETFSIGFRELSAELHRIVSNIQHGIYSRRCIEKAKNATKLHKYELFLDAAVPQESFDYYCLLSRKASSCEMAVNSLKEAKALCSLDKRCNAFVVTPRLNWLGQKIVVLKSSGRRLTPVTNYKTFVRTK